MFRRFLLPTIAATMVLAACGESPFDPAATSEDYALVMFGEYGSALEGTMGTQSGSRPFDGRTARPTLPDSIALSEEQRAAMTALRVAFRAEHQGALDSLRAVFQAAKAAREDGATREEVRAILATGRPIREALRPHVIALHTALRALLTDAQRAWIQANRPQRSGPRP